MDRPASLSDACAENSLKYMCVMGRGGGVLMYVSMSTSVHLHKYQFDEYSNGLHSRTST